MMTLHMAWTITGTVDDIYRPGGVTAAANEGLEQVAGSMLEYGVRHLPVVVTGEVIGMVSTRDLLGMESATTT